MLEFAIFSDYFDIDSFSDFIQTKPTNYYYKGDISPKYKVVRKETCWKYSYDYKRTHYSQNLSSKFLKQFFPLSQKISEYTAKNSLNVKVDIIAECFYEQGPAIIFNKRFLKLLVKLNAEVDVNLYYVREL
jgi:hypothetical protein